MQARCGMGRKTTDASETAPKRRSKGRVRRVVRRIAPTGRATTVAGALQSASDREATAFGVQPGTNSPRSAVPRLHFRAEQPLNRG